MQVVTDLKSPYSKDTVASDGTLTCWLIPSRAIGKRKIAYIVSILLFLIGVVALLAIGGELRAVGVRQDPEDMIEGVVAQLL